MRFTTAAILCGVGVFFGACSKESTTPEDAFTKSTGTTWWIVLDDQQGTVSSAIPIGDPKPIPGAMSDPGAAARTLLKENEALFHVTPDEAAPDVTNLDATGVLVRFGQRIDGVPVDGGEISVRFSAAGAPMFVMGHWISATRTPLVAQVSETTAIDNAKAAHSAGFAGIDPSRVSVSGGAPVTIRTEDDGELRTVRTVNVIVTDEPSKDMGYLIDATNGQVAASWPLLAMDTTVPGSGPGVASFDYARGSVIYNAADRKTFPVTQLATPVDGRAFELRVAALEGGTPAIITLNGREKAGSATAMGPWDPPDSAGPGAAADGYFNVIRTVQFFRDVLGWRSYDGRGSTIRIYAHHADTGCNAGWHSTDNVLYLGDGDRAAGCFPLGGMLDTVAHEFTHGVFRANNRPQTTLSIRGVNEGFADVMGAIVEHHYDPHPARNAAQADAGYNGPAMTPVRDMSNPRLGKAGMNIDHASKAGECGLSPHCLSNILSHAFHLMTVGGTHSSGRVTVQNPIGWERAQGIWWEVLRTATISDGGKAFRDVARATIGAAKAQGVSVQPVACAWHAVGIFNADDLSGLRVDCAAAGSAMDGGVGAVDAGSVRLDTGIVERTDAGMMSGSDAGSAEGTDAGESTAEDSGFEPGEDAGHATGDDDAGPDYCSGMPDGEYCNGATPPPRGYPNGGYRCFHGELVGFYSCSDGEVCVSRDGMLYCE